MVRRVIDKMGHQLEHEDANVSVGEFVRLLQYEKEMMDDGAPNAPREVKITWLQPKEEEPIPAA